MKKYSLLVLSIVIINPCWATIYTGNDLLKLCQGGLEGKQACRLYIAGVLDAFESKNNCIPSDIPMSQMSLIVIKNKGESAETLHYSAAPFVYKSIMKAFPCPE